MPKKKPLPCPCGGASLETCCGPYLSRQAVAPSAQSLMRSRYSAYVMRDEAYLRSTWYRSSRPQHRILEDNDGIKWLGLEVRRQQEDGDYGTVEFVARYKVDGRALRLHEVSRFVREDGHWFYLDGSFPGQGAQA